jgi:CNT family concentrative nucleoside transporter
MNISNYISILGLVVLLFIAWVFSTNRKRIRWEVVVWGIGLQFLFAWFIFVFPAGIKFFQWINKAVLELLNASMAGTQFLFGPLALPPGIQGADGASSLGFIFAIQVLPTIIFFSALMSILYFLNIMPRIINGFARLFTKLMNISGAESVCAASNIFVGVESALTVKPFLAKMTRSELCTILTTGMATVSSNVLALYVFSLQDVFPNIAGHLISASILSAPAALMMAKVLMPEEERPETLGENVKVEIKRDSNIVEAVINGAHAGVKLIVGIAAVLIAVLGLMALADKCLGGIGGLLPTTFTLSLKSILSIVFYPLVLVLGVPLGDVGILAQLMGERLVVTEVVAYQHLAQAISDGLITNPRSIVIATYALCGFAHVSSLAIFIGGISAIVPVKTKELSQVGFRALCAATLACLSTGCIAGVFYVRETILFS